MNDFINILFQKLYVAKNRVWQPLFEFYQSEWTKKLFNAKIMIWECLKLEFSFTVRKRLITNPFSFLSQQIRLT